MRARLTGRQLGAIAAGGLIFALVLGVRQELLRDVAADTPTPAPSLSEAVEQFERQLIAEELRRQEGHLGRTARALNTPKTTLADKVRKYGLNSGSEV